MDSYVHKVRYYETDKMGITHHSNYIRFMEEARVEWMDSMGWSYQKCEELGMVSPVLAVRCKYRKSTTFDDVISVKVSLKAYNGMRLTVGYEMRKDGDLVATGETEHCFLDAARRPLRIPKAYPELDEILKKELALGADTGTL